MINITAIKVKKYYIITDSTEYKSYSYNTSLKDYFFDGEKPEPTFKQNWVKIKKLPKKITKLIKGSSINHRYELKPEFKLGQFKKVYYNNEILDEDGDVYEWFNSIKGLYNFVFDNTPDTEEEVEFKINVILELEEFVEPTTINYSATTGNFGGQRTTVTNSNLENTILDQVLVPDILLHTKPVKLSKQDSYNIVRNHIKMNINPRVAEITSDYDFCLSVCKIIPLAKPYTREVDISKMGSKKPKFVTRMVETKKVKIYEIAPKAYDRYPIIEEFSGNNSEDLKLNIDSYLQSLIDTINAPLCECSNCNGTGVIELTK